MKEPHSSIYVNLRVFQSVDGINFHLLSLDAQTQQILESTTYYERVSNLTIQYIRMQRTFALGHKVV